jgi:hypothetical protein
LKRLFFFASDPSGEARVGLSLFAKDMENGNISAIRLGGIFIPEAPLSLPSGDLILPFGDETIVLCHKTGETRPFDLFDGLYGTPIVFIPHLNSFLCWAPRAHRSGFMLVSLDGEHAHAVGLRPSDKVVGVIPGTSVLIVHRLHHFLLYEYRRTWLVDVSTGAKKRFPYSVSSRIGHFPGL